MMKQRIRSWLVALLLMAPLAALAQGLLGGPSSQSQDDVLPPDQAFRFDALLQAPDRVALRWTIAPGHYLYRHRTSAKAETAGVTLGTLAMPAGTKKTDEFFGEVETYHDTLDATVPVTLAPGVRAFELTVTYQGCADFGFCYPPITKRVRLSLDGSGAAAITDPSSADDSGTSSATVAEQDRLARLISNGHLTVVLATFFGFGLLLAFTPCVLPMIPILSGIIAGQGERTSPRRSFALSVTYVMGMSLTYTVAGALFAAAGQQAQTFFQEPWILVSFALMFVVLAMAMFGMFELSLPSALQTRLTTVSGRQRTGTLIGTFVMGALSALVVSACVAPPLVAALAVIGQAGDVLRGALALFSLSLGMGAPLLLVGVAGGKLLPKAGPWMNSVKALFGVMFLGIAVWMLGRVLPGPLTLALWALIAFVGGYYFGGFGQDEPGASNARLLARGAGLFAIVYGVIMLVGAAGGGSDPLQPLKGASLFGAAAAQAEPKLAFRAIQSVAELDRALESARSAGRPVMLDFYADWCTSCKEMEKYTFTDRAVQGDLSPYVLLKADVTANNADHQALLKRFGVFGPPTTAFFAPAGQECRDHRLVGFVPADDFRSHLQSLATRC
jgi:thiol:disulfide interchange protein DsbD